MRRLSLIVPFVSTCGRSSGSIIRLPREREREREARHVEYLTHVRGEVVRQIEQRRESLIGDRDLAHELVDVLESAHSREECSRQ